PHRAQFGTSRPPRLVDGLRPLAPSPTHRGEGGRRDGFTYSAHPGSPAFCRGRWSTAIPGRATVRPEEDRMASSLVRGRHVICRVRGRTEAEVVDDGAVYQEGGTIVEVGPYRALAAKYRPDELLGSTDHVVLPGLVNSHHHVGLTPFQHGSPHLPSELWFASRMAARDVDPYLDTLYSAFEMVESGVTTVQHLHGWRVAPAARVRAIAERILQAYEDIGMRVSYSYALRDQNRLVYEADEDFLRRLPAELAADVAAWFRGQIIPLEEQLELFV